MKSCFSWIVLLLLVFSLTSTPGQAPPVVDPQYPVPHHDPANEAWTKEQTEKMKRQQKVLRQKQLKEDTDKLLQLATELKTSVDKTNENVLSLDVVKKAEEIEKLAKQVKTNMRDQNR